MVCGVVRIVADHAYLCASILNANAFKAFQMNVSMFLTLYQEKRAKKDDFTKMCMSFDSVSLFLMVSWKVKVIQNQSSRLSAIVPISLSLSLVFEPDSTVNFFVIGVRCSSCADKSVLPSQHVNMLVPVSFYAWVGRNNVGTCAGLINGRLWVRAPLRPTCCEPGQITLPCLHGQPKRIGYLFREISQSKCW